MPRSRSGGSAEDMTARLARLAAEEYCYLTTTGRRSGQPHEIEIWFGIIDGTLYLLSGGGEASDWVKNLQKTPRVTVRIAKQRLSGRARILEGQGKDSPVRKLLAAKYQGWKEGRALSRWARTGLPVAIEFSGGYDS